jgi:RNA polymerase sigma-70 factor (ECF subfamily)
LPSGLPHNEKALLGLVAQGDEDAFSLLFNTYSDKVYKVAYLYLKSYDLATEVVQEIFIKIWDEREKLTAVNSFDTWLPTVARNHIIDFMRKRDALDAAHQKWADGVGKEENNTDYKIRNDQYRQLLRDAVAGLPEQQRIVYQLSKEQGLTREQIAQQLSLSPLTVKTHMQKALRSVRDFLRDHGEIYLLLLLMGR